MALKIKEGSVISPYGATGNSFDHETVLSQAILEHLQTRFPDDIEDDSIADEPEPEILEVEKEPVKEIPPSKPNKS